MDKRHLVLVFLQNPAYYPHIYRHAVALRTKYAQVTVLAAFTTTDPVLPLSDVRLIAIADRNPQGIVSFIRFMLRALNWLMHHSWDLCEAVDPPCLFPAALAKIFKRKKLLYFSMELFQCIPSLVQKPWRRRFWWLLERIGLYVSDRVVTVNQSVALRLQELFAIKKVHVVRSTPNLYIKKAFKTGELRRLCGLTIEQPLLMYQGSLESGRGIEFVSQALLKRPQIHFAVLGRGVLQTWISERATSQANVHYCGGHSFDRLMELASDADVGLVWIEPIAESYRLSLPGKLFEYIQNDIPLLGSPLPEISEHIQKYKLGEVADSFSEESFLNALDRIFDRRLSGQYVEPLQLAKKELCWEQEQQKLLEAFDGL